MQYVKKFLLKEKIKLDYFFILKKGLQYNCSIFFTDPFLDETENVPVAFACNDTSAWSDT